MLREILKKTETDKEPLSCREFESSGMTPADYLKYVNYVQAVRSAAIVVSCREVNSYRYLSRTKDASNQVLEAIWHDFLQFLQGFCMDDFEMERVEQLFPPTALPYFVRRSSASSMYLEDMEADPFLLFISENDFRHVLEQGLARALNDKRAVDLAVSEECDFDKLSLVELRILAEQKSDYELKDSAPAFPIDIGSTEELNKWAEKAERYIQHQLFIDEYEGIEEALKLREESTFNQHEHTLYIYPQILPCKRENHEVLEVTAVIRLPESLSSKAKLNVHYCRDCQKFYISQTSYDLYKKQYRFLPAFFTVVVEHGTSSGCFNRAEQSPLALCGYTVSKNSDMTTEQRQNLLSWIMDYDICGLSKRDIINHLEMLINTNGMNPNMLIAKEKWKDDLRYVLDYKLDAQREHRISRLQHT